MNHPQTWRLTINAEVMVEVMDARRCRLGPCTVSPPLSSWPTAIRTEARVRALLWTVGIVAIVPILLGLFLKALTWLLILGLNALGVAVVMGVIEARMADRKL